MLLYERFFIAGDIVVLPGIHCVQEKNTHSQFLTYLDERCVDLNKNCSGYTQVTVDANNVEIKYSLRAMT